MQTPDKKKLMFLDMQEHPEKYSDEQMEAMMDELDQMPDAGTAWQKFESSNSPAPFTQLAESRRSLYRHTDGVGHSLRRHPFHSPYR